MESNASGTQDASAAADAAIDHDADVAPSDVADAVADAPTDSDAADAADTGDAPDAADAWDQKCWCKSWTDDRYPATFFAQGSCVLHGCPEEMVCCPIPCLAPSVCSQQGGLYTGSCQDQHPPDTCYCDIMDTYLPTCMFPHQCAPEGVLNQHPYDPAKDNAPFCDYPGHTEPPPLDGG